MVRISGNRRVLRSAVGTYAVGTNLPLPRTNSSTCMIGVPLGALALHGHCTLPTLSRCANDTPAKVGVVSAISSMIWLGCS